MNKPIISGGVSFCDKCGKRKIYSSFHLKWVCESCFEIKGVEIKISFPENHRIPNNIPSKLKLPSSI